VRPKAVIDHTPGVPLVNPHIIDFVVRASAQLPAPRVPRHHCGPARRRLV